MQYSIRVLCCCWWLSGIHWPTFHSCCLWSTLLLLLLLTQLLLLVNTAAAADPRRCARFSRNRAVSTWCAMALRCCVRVAKRRALFGSRLEAKVSPDTFETLLTTTWTRPHDELSRLLRSSDIVEVSLHKTGEFGPPAVSVELDDGVEDTVSANCSTTTKTSVSTSPSPTCQTHRHRGGQCGHSRRWRRRRLLLLLLLLLRLLLRDSRLGPSP